MTQAEMLAEIKRLQEANQKLAESKVQVLTCKVSTKGALSVYGLGRWPVTLYAGQWRRLLDNTAKIQAALKVNAGSLTEKE
jgi:hypothetical protein